MYGWMGKSLAKCRSVWRRYSKARAFVFFTGLGSERRSPICHVGCVVGLALAGACSFFAAVVGCCRSLLALFAMLFWRGVLFVALASNFVLTTRFAKVILIEFKSFLRFSYFRFTLPALFSYFLLCWCGCSHALFRFSQALHWRSIVAHLGLCAARAIYASKLSLRINYNIYIFFLC